jgi:hypothetical protein
MGAAQAAEKVLVRENPQKTVKHPNRRIRADQWDCEMLVVTQAASRVELAVLLVGSNQPRLFVSSDNYFT